MKKTIHNEMEMMSKPVTVVVNCDITPSEGCKSAPQSVKLYNGLLAALQITVTEPVDGGEKVDASVTDFSYRWGDGHERLSYPFVVAYLNSRDIPCHICGDGDKCTGTSKLLFDKEVYSIRPYSGAHVAELEEHQRPVHKYNVCGRPDIITTFEHAAAPMFYLPHHVRYALEIKKVSSMNTAAGTTAAIKEGILNMVGLNVDNSSGSPPVIVTDLNGKHYVLYIIMASSNPLEYQADIVYFTKFADAVSFVETEVCSGHARKRNCCTRDFGRPGSAPSVPKCYDDMTGADDVGVVGKVFLSETDDLEIQFSAMEHDAVGESVGESDED